MMLPQKALCHPAMPVTLDYYCHIDHPAEQKINLADLL